MFEKYQIDELFLASINILYPKSVDWVNCYLVINEGGYAYITILRKVGETYFDLNNVSRKITLTRNPKETSYVINHIEPLSNYYTQDGTKKPTFSRRSAVKEAEKHYDKIHQKHLTHVRREIPNKLAQKV